MRPDALFGKTVSICGNSKNCNTLNLSNLTLQLDVNTDKLKHNNYEQIFSGIESWIGGLTHRLYIPIEQIRERGIC